MVDDFGDVDVSGQEFPGAGRRAVGGDQGVLGSWRDLDVGLTNHQHGHVVWAYMGRVVDLQPGTVLEVGAKLRVVPVILQMKTVFDRPKCELRLRHTCIRR